MDRSLERMEPRSSIRRSHECRGASGLVNWATALFAEDRRGTEAVYSLALGLLYRSDGADPNPRQS